MKITRDNVLDFIGIVLIFLFVIRFFSLIRGETIVNIFWLCNHVPLIMGIAILKRNSFLLTAEISFLFVGFFSWISDYFSFVFFNQHLSGATSYLFPIIDKPFFIITSSVHLLTIPLAIVALFILEKPEPKEKFAKLNFPRKLANLSEENFAQNREKTNYAKLSKAWHGSLVHALILLPFVIYFGPSQNLNCFYHPCISLIPNFTIYPLIMFFGYFLIFVIPINFILVKLIKKYNREVCKGVSFLEKWQE